MKCLNRVVSKRSKAIFKRLKTYQSKLLKIITKSDYRERDMKITVLLRKINLRLLQLNNLYIILLNKFVK